MAKLTTAARNALPPSAFAGPDRSYPIPDKAHAIAAERLIDRGNLTAAQKQHVLGVAHAMLNRK